MDEPFEILLSLMSLFMDENEAKKIIRPKNMWKFRIFTIVVTSQYSRRK